MEAHSTNAHSYHVHHANAYDGGSHVTPHRCLTLHPMFDMEMTGWVLCFFQNALLNVIIVSRESDVQKLIGIFIKNI